MGKGDPCYGGDGAPVPCLQGQGGHPSFGGAGSATGQATRSLKGRKKEPKGGLLGRGVRTSGEAAGANESLRYADSGGGPSVRVTSRG